MPVVTVPVTLAAANINSNFSSLLFDLGRVARSQDNWASGRGVVTTMRWYGGLLVWDGSLEDDTGSDGVRMNTFTFTVPTACRLVGLDLQAVGTGDTGAEITVSIAGASINMPEDEPSGSIEIVATKTGATWEDWRSYRKLGQDNFGFAFSNDTRTAPQDADYLLLPGLVYTITSTRTGADNLDMSARPMLTIAMAQELTRR